MQKEFMTSQNWVKKVIYWKLCKKFEFDHPRKWYMYNLESVVENEMLKLLWDFEIQMDHLISARWLDLGIVYKKKKNENLQIVHFPILADHRVKFKEGEKRDIYLDLARELKKLCNMKVTELPTVVDELGTIS